MEKLTNKEKILMTLLDSPKTTGQIAIALGYKDDKGRGIYKNISSDLNTLETGSFIHRIKSEKKVGAPAKTYDINYAGLNNDISILRDMLKKYPSIEPDLQENEKIVSMVADKQNLFVEHPLNSSELETVKEMLHLSRSFFRNYVSNPNFLDTFRKLWEDAHPKKKDEYNIPLDYKAGTKIDIVRDGEIWKQSYSTSPLSEILDNAIKHSIITDRIDGVYNPETF